MSSAPPSVPARRLDTLDGVRGIAILLVILSHGWVLWPVEWIDANEFVRPLFRSGNTAVTVFLVAAGLLTYRTFTGRGGLTEMRPGVVLVRRVLRVGPSLWLMLLVLMAIAAVDTTDRSPKADNADSVAHVLTYTWNWYVQSNLVTSRPDFGHLWYLSVDMQAFVIMAVLVYVLRRQPAGLLAALAGLYLLLTWWRFHVTDTEFTFQVLVRTTARMDAFVLGVLLGASLPYLARLRPSRRGLGVTTAVSAVALLPLVWYTSRDDHFLHWGGTLLQIALAVLFGAAALGGSARGTRWLSSGPLTFLGQRSLLLYIWHYPIFVFVQRHTPDWSWQQRTVVGLAATVVVFLVLDRMVERRVADMLRTDGWRRLDAGIPAYLAARGRELAAGIRRRPGAAAGAHASPRGSQSPRVPRA